jgi:hypothetical protein
MIAKQAILLAAAVLIVAAKLDAQTSQEQRRLDSIQVGLGDTMLVYCGTDANLLTLSRTTDSTSTSTRTMMIGLTFEDFGGTNATILRVSNPLESVLRYRASIRRKGDTRFTETTIVPVLPKITSMEMWPDQIDRIILFDFRTTEDARY